ncbi:NAD-dependent epimerase/dehydratase [Penicillium atrosanguineum]|nr:NAD-dependent epimerase/dehydratase [Penicillium atrosanguineum]
MSTERLLITGVTGYIGFQTLVLALENKHYVRAVVRSERNISDLKSKITTIGEIDSQLEFAIVPDFLEKDAIFNVLDGISVILHLASPLAVETDNYENDIINPSVSMVTSVLDAAARVPTVRRVVLTSSCVTLIPFEWNMNPDSEKLYTVDEINTDVAGPFTGAMQAYWASKALARAATRTFIAERRPQFNFINLLPGVVIGPDNRLTNDPTANTSALLKETRAAVLAPVLTSSLNSSFPYVGIPVHVADVARAHIDAIDSNRVPGNTEYILSSDAPEGVVWNRDAAYVAQNYFAGEVKSQVLPMKGSLTTVKWSLDTKKTEVFGWRFTGFEETLRQLLAQYLQLRQRE